GHRERLRHALDSLVSPGVIVSGGEVMGSVISPGTKVNSWSSARASVIFDNVDVGRNAVVHRAIIDKKVRHADGPQVGVALGRGVNAWSPVRDSVIVADVDVGRNAVVHRAIIDKNVRIADGAQVGVDLEHALERGFTVTESGITLVPKGATVRR